MGRGAAGELLLKEYRARHEKVLTYLAVANAFLIGVFTFTLPFMGSSSVKVAVQMAYLGTIALIGIAVMRLWYWTMNAKHDTMRELKLMRLQMVSREAALAASDGSFGIVETLQRTPHLFMKAVAWSNIGAAVLGYVLGWIVRLS